MWTKAYSRDANQYPWFYSRPIWWNFSTILENTERFLENAFYWYENIIILNYFSNLF